MPADAPSTAIVWTSADRIDAARKLVTSAGLKVVAAGAPEPKDASDAAEAFGVDVRTDLRASLASEPCSAFLLLTPGAFGASPERRDGDAINAAFERGAAVVSAEPIPVSGDAASAGNWLKGQEGQRAIDRMHRMPDPGHGVGFREADELIGSLDNGYAAIHAATIRCTGSPPQGSAGARLLDACTLLVRFVGTPELVDAAFVGTTHGAETRAEPPTLRGLSGLFAITARFGDGRAASIVASDRFDTHVRDVDLVLDEGVLVVRPNGFRWNDTTGKARDAAGDPEKYMSWNEAAAGSLTNALDALDARVATPRRDPLPPLAIAHAALLSATTGQPESPAVHLRTLGV
ncbi:MAG: hypothetical protein AAF235_05645 [Planctomycetota bacterium]